jgi:hypothetical protein
MATITCHDCGDQRRSVPSNTRYCKKCRVLRELVYWHRRTRHCRECEREYAPLSRTDYWCSKCDPGLEHKTGPCGLYPNKPHEGAPTFAQIPICAGCFRDPRKRDWLIRVMQKGRNDRRTANQPKETSNA